MKTMKFSSPLYVFIFCTAVVFTAASCGGKNVEMKKFAAVYCDLNIAQDTLDFNEFVKKKKEILRKYEISEKELKNTYEYYYNNPELWEKFFKIASERIDDIKKGKTL
jgi:hypothetical protein